MTLIRTSAWGVIATSLIVMFQICTTAFAEPQSISGRVVEDENHQHPIEGARLWWQIERDFLVEGTSNADGRFTLRCDHPIPDVMKSSYTIWVLKDGKRLATAFARQPKGIDTPELVIPLERIKQASFVIHSPDHQPLVGVRVEPWHFKTYQSYDIIPRPIRELLTVTSDADGEVMMPQLARPAFFSLNVIAPEWGTQRFRLDGPTLPDVHRVLTLARTGRIEGRLHSHKSEIVQNVQVHLTSGDEEWTDSGWTPQGEDSVTTDAEGRFDVSAMAIGPLRIDIIGEPDALELPRLPESRSQIVQEGQALSLRIDYEPSVPVWGTIRTRDHKTPVPNATISIRYGTGRQGVMVQSNAEGRFEARVLSGSVSTQVIANPEEFQMFQETGNIGARSTFVSSGRVKPVELSPIELVRLIEMKGRLVDQNGDPVSRTKLNGVMGHRRYGFATTSEEGEFTLLIPETIKVKEFEIWLEDGEKRVEPSQVEFEPLIIHVHVPDAAPSAP